MSLGMAVALAVAVIAALLLLAGMADGQDGRGLGDRITAFLGLEPTHVQPGAPFKTTWETTLADETRTIPLEGSEITIDWGDGQTSSASSGLVSHEYAAAAEYTISISGGLTAIILKESPDANKLKSIDQWGDISWMSMRDAFHGASAMIHLAKDAPDLSKVTDMSGMFSSAISFNQPINDWDVSEVTNMSHMFTHNIYFNQPLDDWDVSEVTDTSYMFYAARSFNQPLNDWDVSEVTDTSYMFYAARSFNQPLSDWDVSSAANMSRMFSFTDAFNQPLSDWDVSSVTDMNRMFSRSFFNQPLSDWDVSSVTDMNRMFSRSFFNQPLSDWDVSSVTDMNRMFSRSFFNQPLSDWDVSSVTDMNHMFSDAQLFNQPLSDWDVSSVTDMNHMFSDAQLFNQPLSDWDVSSVTNMKDMFDDSKAFTQNLGNWLVVLNDTMISEANETLAISTQNSYLDGRYLIYAVNDTRFAVVGDDISLNPSWEPLEGTYPLEITVTGEPLGSGPHFRTVEITVGGGK